MSEVQKRVEALRQAKKAEEDAAENKRKDELIQWEAEMILALEEYTDERIMKEFTDHMDIYEYLANLIHKINCYKFIQTIVTHTQYSVAYLIKFLSLRDVHNEGVFKIKYLVNHINYIKLYPEYIEYTKILAEEQRIIKEKEEEEKRIANEKKQQEKQEAERIAKIKKEEDDRNKILKNIDDTNKNIRNILRGRGSILDTFTEVTLDNLDITPKEFLSNSKVRGWAHYSVDFPNKSCSPCFNGISYFSSYYEEGKVPFLTKCPMCNSPTKFNYLNRYAFVTISNACVSAKTQTLQRSNTFTSVYCDNHYVYYSNKHYIISESEGKEISIDKADTPDCRYLSWKPSGKWSIWDLSEPVLVKAVERAKAAEKKRKDTEDIQKQIAELQAKLTLLQT